MGISVEYIDIIGDYCSLLYSQSPCAAQLGFDQTLSPWASTFDGTNDYLTRGGALSGIADFKTLTGSFWLKRKSAASGFIIGHGTAVAGGATRFWLLYDSSIPGLHIAAWNSSGTIILDVYSTATIALNEWVHFSFSFDLSNVARRHIYQDGVSVLTGINTYTNDIIQFSGGDWGIAAAPDGGTKFNGDLSEIWFNAGTYLDLSIASNREKFRLAADGRPVYLGTNGQTPLGSSPFIYLGNATAFFTTNLGTGGNFTLHGSLDIATFATGGYKCFNTLSTCQDRANFTNVTKIYRFTRPSFDWTIDTNYPFYPSIKDIQFDPGTISLGADLGQRATLTITFEDHKDSDVFDKYRLERGWDAFDAGGSFFGKFRARNMFLQGRPLTWSLTDAWGDETKSFVRHYVIESFDGPNENGEYKIVAKDVLKLADGDRAMCPKASNGFLSADITPTTTSITLQPAGIGSEYPTSGSAAIGGSEVIAINARTGDVLTVTRGAISGLPAVDHKAGDRVQLVQSYSGTDPALIIQDLLINFANVPSGYIPISLWLAETAAYLGQVYTTFIGQPTSVATLISELCEQCGISLWWDDIDQTIGLRVIHGGSPIRRVTEDEIISGTLDIHEQPDKRLSQVHTYFGQRNPLTSLTDKANYSSVSIQRDAQSETDYGSAKIKEIFSRWIPSATGRTIADRIGQILLARFKNPPRHFKWQTFRRPALLEMAQIYEMTAYCLQDQRGFSAAPALQITRTKPVEQYTEYEAEEMIYTVPAADLTNRKIIIDSNQYNLNLLTAHNSIFPAPTAGTTVTFTIAAGVKIGSISTSLPAVDVGIWPAGVTVTLVNQGRIQGKGGRGGTGGVAMGVSKPGNPGETGGTAFYTRQALTVNNTSGQIWGGGGGGGGGSGYAANDNGGAGGGGGAGYDLGTAGSGTPTQYIAGQPGTTELGGAGGNGSALVPGGAGGNPGLAGAAGSSSSPHVGGAGGGAGNAIDGNAFITYSGTGSRLGGII